jgi:aminoglycoside phosphotransferase (APT) family kinase protein
MAEIPARATRAAAAFGFEAAELRPLAGNSGSSWGAGPHVLRVGRRAVMAAEAAAMAAVAGGVPVPRVIDRTELGADTAILLERLPGLTAADLARREPRRAVDAGRTCGQVHARLAAIPAPADLRAARLQPVGLPPAPAAPGSAAAARGSGAAGSAPGPARVLHLDLHPFNILLTPDGALAGVLDWANAAAGDPVLDQARTWAILTLDPAARARRAEPGWRSLTDGWLEAGGLGAVPAWARVWACEFMLADLARRYPPPELEHIRRARDLSCSGGPVRLNNEAGPPGGEGTRL